MGDINNRRTANWPAPDRLIQDASFVNNSAGNTTVADAGRRPLAGQTFGIETTRQFLQKYGSLSKFYKAFSKPLTQSLILPDGTGEDDVEVFMKSLREFLGEENCATLTADYEPKVILTGLKTLRECSEEKSGKVPEVVPPGRGLKRKRAEEQQRPKELSDNLDLGVDELRKKFLIFDGARETNTATAESYPLAIEQFSDMADKMKFNIYELNTHYTNIFERLLRYDTTFQNNSAKYIAAGTDAQIRQFCVKAAIEPILCLSVLLRVRNDRINFFCSLVQKEFHLRILSEQQPDQAAYRSVAASVSREAMLSILELIKKEHTSNIFINSFQNSLIDSLILLHETGKFNSARSFFLLRIQSIKQKYGENYQDTHLKELIPFSNEIIKLFKNNPRINMRDKNKVRDEIAFAQCICIYYILIYVFAPSRAESISEALSILLTGIGLERTSSLEPSHADPSDPLLTQPTDAARRRPEAAANDRGSNPHPFRRS